MSRVDLLDRLSALLPRQSEADGPLAVLLVRLRNLGEFRIANGYGMGERLAETSTGLIREALRPGDEVHVSDESEIVVLLPRLRDRNHALLAGTRILRIFDPPVGVDDRAIPVSAAVGLSVYPEDGADAETLLRRAGLALRQARRGPERCIAYAAGTDASQVPYASLREAISANRLEVHLQPILDLAQRKWVGFESHSNDTRSRSAALFGAVSFEPR